MRPEGGEHRAIHKDRSLRIWLPTIRAGSGSDVFVERLSFGLERAGHEPLVQWFDHRYELAPWLLRTVPAPRDADIVHANSWNAFAFKRRGIPLVVTEHHYVGDPAFHPYRTLAQALYHRLLIEPMVHRSYHAADSIVAVSKHTAKAIKQRTGLVAEVIYNWVDLEKFTPTDTNNEDRRSNRPFRLLFVGNPSIRKGADLLPKLAERLGSEFEVRCMGGLRSRHSFKRAPDNLKVLRPVASSGMPAVYGGVDAVLVLSRYEAFGYVALEAMACGKAVIGFNCTGTAEICVDGETGLLVPVDDLAEVEQACRLLAADPNLLSLMQARARQRSVDFNSEELAINKYVQKYRVASNY